MDEKRFINNLSTKLQMKPGDVSKLIDAFIETVKIECGELNSISIPGFGKFQGSKTDERIDIKMNGNTEERYLVPPQVLLQFVPSNVLKTKLMLKK